MLKDNRCVGLKMSGAYDYLAYYLEMLPTPFYLFIFSSKKKEEKGCWKLKYMEDTTQHWNKRAG